MSMPQGTSPVRGPAFSIAGTTPGSGWASGGTAFAVLSLRLQATSKKRFVPLSLNVSCFQSNGNGAIAPVRIYADLLAGTGGSLNSLQGGPPTLQAPTWITTLTPPGSLIEYSTDGIVAVPGSGAVLVAAGAVPAQGQQTLDLSTRFSDLGRYLVAGQILCITVTTTSQNAPTVNEFAWREI